MLKIQKSKAAVSAMAMAIVAILAISAAAAGIYVFVLSDEEGEGGGNNGDGGGGQSFDADLDDPMITGTLGVGTVYTYDYNKSGSQGECKITIAGQSGSYYLIGISLNGELQMVHKQTGKLRFSEYNGDDGMYEGETLKQWKLSTMEDFDFDTGVKKTNFLIFSSNSKAILPKTFYIHEITEIDGIKETKITEGTLKSKSESPATAYEKSEQIGNKLIYSITGKIENNILYNGKMAFYWLSDYSYDGGNVQIFLYLVESEIKENETIHKIRMFAYFPFPIDPLLVVKDLGEVSESNFKGYDTINTKWGNVECEYYSADTTAEKLHDDEKIDVKVESYVGKDDGIVYMINFGSTTQYGYNAKYVLEDYVMKS